MRLNSHRTAALHSIVFFALISQTQVFAEEPKPAVCDCKPMTVTVTRACATSAIPQPKTDNVAASAEGVSGEWSGSLKGKLFSLKTATESSLAETGIVGATLTQTGNDLGAQFTINGKVFALSGKIGGGNFLLAGKDAALNFLALSGHLNRSSDSAKGIAIVVGAGRSEEFTFTISKSAQSTKSTGNILTSRASGTVGIKDFSFGTAPITINIGDTVTWTNNDATTHTATSDTNVFDTGNLSPGKSASFTFTTAGTFPYHCSIHSSMKGSVVVLSAPPSGGGGITSVYNGKFSGKSFDLTNAKGASDKGLAKFDITDASGMLTANITLADKVFSGAVGESGNGNFWILGTSGTDTLVISGHMNKKADAATASALLLTSDHAEELKISVKKQ